MKRVLIVEDDHCLLKLVTQLFHHRGYKVDAADSVSGGRTLAQPDAYSLYLLDVNLPDGSGIALCEHIRHFGDTVPIVVYSADESNELPAMRAGANAFIPKGSTLDEQLDQVLNYFEKEPSEGERVA